MKARLSLLFPSTLVVTLALIASCAHAPSTTSTSHSQQLASESAAAMNAKDYNKAQTLAAEATRLSPDFAEAWVEYGMASVRLGQVDQARRAYERALSLHQARYRQDPSDANQVCQQIFVLTLLDRSSEAEALMEKARAAHASDSNFAAFAGHYSEAKKEWSNWQVATK